MAYPGILFEGGSTNSVKGRGQREWGSGGGGVSPLVRGSGGSCNMVQEISFHIAKIFLIFGTLRLIMMTTNLFVIVNVKKLRTDGRFRILVPFFRTSQTDRYSLKHFGLRTGRRTFFKALAQTVHNYRRNSFACGEPEFTSSLFLIISAKSSRTGLLRHYQS